MIKYLFKAIAYTGNYALSAIEEAEAKSEVERIAARMSEKEKIEFLLDSGKYLVYSQRLNPDSVDEYDRYEYELKGAYDTKQEAYENASCDDYIAQRQQHGE